MSGIEMRTERDGKVEAVAKCFEVTGDEDHVRQRAGEMGLSEEIVLAGLARAAKRSLKSVATGLLLSLGLSLSAGAAPICRVNVNTASVGELQALPRVGPALAAALVAARPLVDLAALDSVPRVGPVTFEKLTPFVVFEGPTDVSGCKVKTPWAGPVVKAEPVATEPVG